MSDKDQSKFVCLKFNHCFFIVIKSKCLYPEVMIEQAHIVDLELVS